MHFLAALLVTSTLCQVAPAPNGDVHLLGCGAGFPDNILWHLDRADSRDGALDTRTTRPATGRGAVVYIFDTGILRDREAFGANVIGALKPTEPIDGVFAICGEDRRDPSVNPCDGHGTAVASIVGGAQTGVAPDAKLVSVYMQSHSIGTVGLWLEGMQEVIRHAWDPATPQFRTGIVNISFPTRDLTYRPYLFEQKMHEMIDGVDAEGRPDPNGKRFLFIATAGDFADGCAAVYPASLGAANDGLIAVGGIDRTNRFWSGSCDGEVLAPAAALLVATIGARDTYRSGSSNAYATAYVAGLAALLLEKDPSLTPRQLEELITARASHTADGSGRVAIFDLPSSERTRRRAVRR